MSPEHGQAPQILQHDGRLPTHRDIALTSSTCKDTQAHIVRISLIHTGRIVRANASAKIRIRDVHT